MTYKEAKEYHKKATEMLIKRSLGDIIKLQKEILVDNHRFKHNSNKKQPLLAVAFAFYA